MGKRPWEWAYPWKVGLVHLTHCFFLHSVLTPGARDPHLSTPGILAAAMSVSRSDPHSSTIKYQWNWLREECYILLYCSLVIKVLPRNPTTFCFLSFSAPQGLTLVWKTSQSNFSQQLIPKHNWGRVTLGLLLSFPGCFCKWSFAPKFTILFLLWIPKICYAFHPT